MVLPRLACKRCGKAWVPRIDNPAICPRCKSARWREPKMPRAPKKARAARLPVARVP